MSETRGYFARCPKGLEYLLVDELKALGISEAREKLAGVVLEADTAQAVRAMLESRLASRIILPVAEGPVRDAEELYALAHAHPWHQHFSADKSFLVRSTGQHQGIAHSGFAALKVKDAIADRFRAEGGARPDVDTDSPQIVVDLYLDKQRAALGLDLSGVALHARGWRQRQGAAPIKENLAAAMLLRAGWPAIAQAGGALVDPCCGSGTLLIEAVWMAAGVPPTWLQDQFSILHWNDVDAALIQEQRRALDARARSGLEALAPAGIIAYGSDIDSGAVASARQNARVAGVPERIALSVADISALRAPEGRPPGVLLSNPPYGERLEEQRELLPLYAQFGEQIRTHFMGYSCALITSDETLAQAVDRPVRKRYQLKNGALPCTLYLFDSERMQQKAADRALPHGAEMVANRIARNLRRIKQYVAKRNLTCYRVYDADIPEYNAAIDLYEGQLHIQEYAPPRDIDEADAKKRFDDLCLGAARALNIGTADVFRKRRERQRGVRQYSRQANNERYRVVSEGGHRFWVNLEDYLDTGLFLDSREIRASIAAQAKGQRFLNLFCYTASASVYAAAAGAKSSLSIDLSPNYIHWAEENYTLNNIDSNRHRLLQGDVMQWLEHSSDQFDLIYLDPPTFSNSKRTENILDLGRDHAVLIDHCMARLAPGGTMILVTNARRFTLAPELAERYAINETSKRTLPPDFERNQRIHHSFVVRHRE